MTKVAFSAYDIEPGGLDAMRLEQQAGELSNLRNIRRAIWYMPLVQGAACLIQLYFVWSYLQDGKIGGAIISALLYLFFAGIACIFARKYRALYAELLSKTAVAKLKGEWPYDRASN